MKSLGSMGLFGIENHTEEPLELVLACRHRVRSDSESSDSESGDSDNGDSTNSSSEKEAWKISPYRLDTQDDDYWEIGFEDRPENLKLVDWNDVRVCITWIR